METQMSDIQSIVKTLTSNQEVLDAIPAIPKQSNIHHETKGTRRRVNSVMGPNMVSACDISRGSQAAMVAYHKDMPDVIIKVCEQRDPYVEFAQECIERGNPYKGIFPEFYSCQEIKEDYFLIAVERIRYEVADYSDYCGSSFKEKFKRTGRRFLGAINQGYGNEHLHDHDYSAEAENVDLVFLPNVREVLDGPMGFLRDVYNRCQRNDAQREQIRYVYTDFHAGNIMARNYNMAKFDIDGVGNYNPQFVIIDPLWCESLYDESSEQGARLDALFGGLFT